MAGTADTLGFCPERLTRIGPAIHREIERGSLPGAVTLIARHGQIVHFEAHGWLDAGKSVPMPLDAVFRAYSMTKPIVSVAAMALVEQGLISLRDPVGAWLPELAQMTVLQEQRRDGWTTRAAVPARNPITVQDLLRHTSGLTYASNPACPELKEAYEQADIMSYGTDISAEQFLERLGRIPLAYEPGTRWEYGVSTDVLGILVERVTGERLDHHLRRTMFAPLGMPDTGFQAMPEQLSRLADALDSDAQKAVLWQGLRIETDPGLRYRRGGGGAISTAQDYFRFAQMVLDGGRLGDARILSRKTVQLMLSDHIAGLAGGPSATTGPGYGFGLGFAVRLQDGIASIPGSKGDAMWAGVGGTSFTIDPAEGIVGVVMAAAPSARLHLRNLFKNLLYGSLVE